MIKYLADKVFSLQKKLYTKIDFINEPQEVKDLV